MKMLLIGQSVEDHILFDGLEKPVTPGGIFYSAAGLSSLKSEDDEIYLCTSIAEKNYHLFEWIYNDIDLSYSTYVEKIPEIYLTVRTGYERDECYNHITDSLSVTYDNLNSFDGIYINMITGFDISLETLKEIRKHFPGIIYLDVHSLARGLNDKMERHFRIIPSFSEWAKNVTIIQVNDNELLTLSENQNEKEIAKEVLSYDAKILIVTYGERGAGIYFIEENELKYIFIPVDKVETLNQVGCGDVFGSAYFYKYLKTKNYIEALRFAVKASQCVASYGNIMQIRNLKIDVS
ncbi:MAG: carbohydrate kinase family protein [Ignavibacteriaceae bacterium]|nr:carbohydrate kinase family protein [Ignavibacteriaceae bacterium]